MYRWLIREVIDHATESVTGSLMTRRHAHVALEVWRAWRIQWIVLEGLPPDERFLAVCMYCERFRVATGEWLEAPAELAEMLHDGQVIQLTHGICPICFSARLNDLPGGFSPRPASGP